MSITATTPSALLHEGILQQAIATNNTNLILEEARMLMSILIACSFLMLSHLKTDTALLLRNLEPNEAPG